jgi:transposase
VIHDLLLLSERQLARNEPCFFLANGIPRVDDRRVVSDIANVIKHGQQWKDAPKEYRPHKALYNRSFAEAALACSSASRSMPRI